MAKHALQRSRVDDDDDDVDDDRKLDGLASGKSERPAYQETTERADGPFPRVPSCRYCPPLFSPYLIFPLILVERTLTCKDQLSPPGGARRFFFWLPGCSLVGCMLNSLLGTRFHGAEHMQRLSLSLLTPFPFPLR
ncbi:hypothetical protein IF2G_06740 [Cordyceps javanica]|nr:hypothetical protein IF2G_06740 [Cordyceps javanica]